jgi:hypothetical protein
MPEMNKTASNRGKGGKPGVIKQAKIRTPFEYTMADKGPGKGKGKRSSGKSSGKRY